MAKTSKTRFNFRLVAAIASIFLLAGLTFAFFTLGRPATFTTVAATHDIATGVKLAEGDFTPVVLANVPAGTLLLSTGEARDMIGRVATTTIFKGTLLQKSFFYRPGPAPAASGNPGDPLAAQAYAYRWTELLTGDNRGVVIIVDPTSTYVSPGDYVDVVFVSDVSVARMFTKKVLYVVPRTDPAASSTNSALPTGTALILDGVTAQEALALDYASVNGRIFVSVASPDSVGIPSTIEMTPEEFTKMFGITTPGNSAPPFVEPSPTPAPSDGGLFPSEAPASPSASPTSSSSVPGLP
jgi:hypothetical protein